MIRPTVDGAACVSTLTNIVILGPDDRIFVTESDVVRSVTDEHVDVLRLKDPELHRRQSSIAQIRHRGH